MNIEFDLSKLMIYVVPLVGLLSGLYVGNKELNKEVGFIEETHLKFVEEIYKPSLQNIEEKYELKLDAMSDKISDLRAKNNEFVLTIKQLEINESEKNTKLEDLIDEHNELKDRFDDIADELKTLRIKRAAEQAINDHVNDGFEKLDYQVNKDIDPRVKTVEVWFASSDKNFKEYYPRIAQTLGAKPSY